MVKNSIAVFGLGKTGKALLNFLLKKNDFSKIYLYNDEDLDTSNDEILNYISLGVEFCFGKDGLLQIVESVDLIVLSPGVNAMSKRFDIIREKGIRIISEIEFAYSYIRNKDIKIIALTGTNGKSTTVSLIYHFLHKSGLDVVLAGNIGNPFIAEVENIKNNSFLVLELSSYQLEDIENFKPDISLILNITPDHLDRYGNMGAYLDAKLNIIKNQEMSDYLIYNEDDEILNKISINNVTKINFSLLKESSNSFLLDKSVISKLNGEKIISLKNNPLKGIHNLENIIAAVTAVLIAGLDAEEIEKNLASFKGLQHRMEFSGSYNGVEFINDSKATNIDSAIKSSMSFDEDMVIILGGKDKDGDFRLLDNVLYKQARAILLIGDAQEKIWSQFEQCREKSQKINSFDEAVSIGYEILKDDGGVLLLAPACASFDMFDNFEDRGNKFKLSVEKFINKMSENG